MLSVKDFERKILEKEKLAILRFFAKVSDVAVNSLGEGMSIITKALQPRQHAYSSRPHLLIEISHSQKQHWDQNDLQDDFF